MSPPAANAFRSMPEQKTGPAPGTMTTCTPGSGSASRRPSEIATRNSGFIALRTSGRFMVSSAMLPSEPARSVSRRSLTVPPARSPGHRRLAERGHGTGPELGQLVLGGDELVAARLDRD